MAHYTWNYSCGHAGEGQLYGKSSEREAKIHWYESSGLCPECYQKAKEYEREKEAIVAAEELKGIGLPDLEGTEKQIRYGNVCRLQAFRRCQLLDMKDWTSPAMIEKWGADLGERINLFRESLRRSCMQQIEKVMQEKSSTWWIEHKDGDAQSLIVVPAVLSTPSVLAMLSALPDNVEPTLRKMIGSAAAAASEKARADAKQDSIQAARKLVRELCGEGACLTVWHNESRGIKRIYCGKWTYHHTGDTKTDPKSFEGITPTDAIRAMCEQLCNDWNSLKIHA